MLVAFFNVVSPRDPQMVIWVCPLEIQWVPIKTFTLDIRN